VTPTPQDIAQATVWLTGVLEYGEQFVIARDRIAMGIAEERRRVLAPVLAEAQDFDAESIMGLTADVEQVWRDAADRIRLAVEGLAPSPIHAHHWVPDLWLPKGELCVTCRERRAVSSS
jgi:hypothetical protein